jgi:hypothetical protein
MKLYSGVQHDISTASETFVANGILCHNSGAAEWNDAGYLVGIVTYGSTEHGGKNDRNCKGFNPSAFRIPQLLGVTTQSSVEERNQHNKQHNKDVNNKEDGLGFLV